MKYCVNYRKDFKYNDKVEELNIHFRRQDTSLLDFLLERQKQRINIIIDDEDDFIKNNSLELFEAIAVEHPEINFSLRFKDYKYDKVKQIVNLMKDIKVKINFFFETFIKDYDTLWGYIQLKPSDVYIVENLGFELETVSKILHENNIRVRTFPNVAQSSWRKAPALKKFFIRPDDIYIYEPYVDVMEFFGKNESIATYYKIYAIDKKWPGKLNEVIIDFNDESIDGRFLLPQFAIHRLNCGKHCLKGRPCKICETISKLAETLEKHNLLIKSFDK